MKRNAHACFLSFLFFSFFLSCWGCKESRWCTLALVCKGFPALARLRFRRQRRGEACRPNPTRVFFAPQSLQVQSVRCSELISVIFPTPVARLGSARLAILAFFFFSFFQKHRKRDALKEWWRSRSSSARGRHELKTTQIAHVRLSRPLGTRHIHCGQRAEKIAASRRLLCNPMAFGLKRAPLLPLSPSVLLLFIFFSPQQQQQQQKKKLQALGTEKKENTENNKTGMMRAAESQAIA